MYKQDSNNDGKIYCGYDKYMNPIWKTQEQLDLEAAELEKWQREKFARELGIEPDTTDKEELLRIDAEYERMLFELNLWNMFQQRKLDKILKEARGTTDND